MYWPIIFAFARLTLMWWRANELIFARMPLFERLLAEVRAPLPRDDRRADGVVRRVDAHGAFAQEDDRPEVALVHPVRRQRVARTRAMICSRVNLG